MAGPDRLCSEARTIIGDFHEDGTSSFEYPDTNFRAFKTRSDRVLHTVFDQCLDGECRDIDRSQLLWNVDSEAKPISMPRVFDTQVIADDLELPFERRNPRLVGVQREAKQRRQLADK